MQDRHIKEIAQAISGAGINIAIAIFMSIMFASCMIGFSHH